MIKNITLIQEIVGSLQPKDPVQEAIQSLDNPQQNPNWITQIDDDQVDTMIEYMHEIIRDRQMRGNDVAVGDAAWMAMEDVSGFETVPQKVAQQTVERLIATYEKKYGA